MKGEEIVRTLVLGLAVLLVALAVAAVGDRIRLAELADAGQLSWRQQEILVVRASTHRCQDELRRPRRPVAERIVRGGPPYRRWVLNSWRADRRLYCGAVRRLNADSRRAIRYVWGEHAERAIRVARCESDYYPTDGRPDVVARNGQYLGMFQMGEWARAAYGHGSTPLEQAFAAYANFVENGWSQWQCA